MDFWDVVGRELSQRTGWWNLPEGDSIFFPLVGDFQHFCRKLFYKGCELEVGFA
jgi:hypothetical protein